MSHTKLFFEYEIQLNQYGYTGKFLNIRLIMSTLTQNNYCFK